MWAALIRVWELTSISGRERLIVDQGVGDASVRVERVSWDGARSVLEFSTRLDRTQIAALAGWARRQASRIWESRGVEPIDGWAGNISASPTWHLQLSFGGADESMIVSRATGEFVAVIDVAHDDDRHRLDLRVILRCSLTSLDVLADGIEQSLLLDAGSPPPPS